MGLTTHSEEVELVDIPSHHSYPPHHNPHHHLRHYHCYHPLFLLILFIIMIRPQPDLFVPSDLSARVHGGKHLPLGPQHISCLIDKVCIYPIDRPEVAC